FQVEAAAGGATLHWIADSLAAGQEKEYVLCESVARPIASQVKVAAQDAGPVSVQLGEELFTRYVYGEDVPKPCLYPVIGPFGQGVTRAYPQEQAEGDSTDHIHHRSLYAAWGDVNGSDNWSEEEGSGRMAHRYFEATEGGPVFGRIVALNDWVDVAGNRLMQDRLEYRFYNTPPSFRVFDLSVTLYASDGDVRFGDTKEGGIMSLRVASSMEAARAGRIENSLGGVNEAETWGKQASWCDYSGPVGDHIVGIAVFDHPSNLRYPTFWHVRNYGLMTANPFGLSHFVGEGHDGSHVLPAGEHLCFRYRVLIHAGDAQEGSVREKYLEWIFPPSATVQD
ncbi:MAG: PmoA family protein, partial [Candidatus Brocadiae bacterium]|nr:PmoA family protein [Candidatus Brocadiia bacterium]